MAPINVNVSRRQGLAEAGMPQMDGIPGGSDRMGLSVEAPDDHAPMLVDRLRRPRPGRPHPAGPPDRGVPVGATATGSAAGRPARKIPGGRPGRETTSASAFTSGRRGAPPGVPLPAVPGTPPGAARVAVATGRLNAVLVDVEPRIPTTSGGQRATSRRGCRRALRSSSPGQGRRSATSGWSPGRSRRPPRRGPPRRRGAAATPGELARPASGRSAETVTAGVLRGLPARESQPRPPVWWSVTTTAQGRARRSASALVEASAGWTTGVSHGPPVRPRRRRPVRVRGSAHWQG